MGAKHLIQKYLVIQRGRGDDHDDLLVYPRRKEPKP